jgi:hypothetical protein
MLSRPSLSPWKVLALRPVPRTILAVALLGSAFAFAQDSRGFKMAVPASATLLPGTYYALVIGIDEYPSLQRLSTAVRDAQAVGALLELDYGFNGHVTYLLNQDASRKHILDALEGPGGYGQTLGESDNLLIYFAGHGYYDTRADKAYWLPVDAESSLSSNRISADDLTTAIRGIASHHVLIISDSCYSGDLTRDGGDLNVSRGEQAFLARMLAAPSRSLLSSGGNEPVSDSGPDGHSIFAAAFLHALAEQSATMFTAADIAGPVNQMVRAHSSQIPEYFRVGNAMPKNFPIDVGDFVFTRTSGESTPKRTSEPSGKIEGLPSAPAPVAASAVEASAPASTNAVEPSPAPADTIDTPARVPINHVEVPAPAPTDAVEMPAPASTGAAGTRSPLDAYLEELHATDMAPVHVRTISGAVTDADKQVIPGATVVALAQDQNGVTWSFRAQTDENGHYELKYDRRFEYVQLVYYHAGFALQILEFMHPVGSRVDTSLKIAFSRETITITCSTDKSCRQ